MATHTIYARVIPSGFGHANHPGAFISPKSQRIEVKGLVRSKAGTAKTQKRTSPTRSNTPGNKDFIAVESQRSIPCRATAAAQNLSPRTKLRADGINVAAKILFIVLISAWSNCRLGGIIARRTAAPPYQHGVEQARHYAAQYDYAYAESQWKISLAPNARFGDWHAARERDIHERVPNTHYQPGTEGGQEREAATTHGKCAFLTVGVST